MAERVTKLEVQAGVHLDNTPSALTQAVLEVGIHDPADVTLSQQALEVGRKFATGVRASQIILEVIRKRTPRYYTDGAAGCNFTY